MTYMLCRNRVEDYAKWKAVLDAHTEAHQAAGLQLVEMWQGVEDPNNVFFMFEVGDIGRARDFVSDPEAAKAGKVSGVIDGEIHFVESVPGYWSGPRQ